MEEIILIDETRIQNTLGKMDYYLKNHNSVCISVSGGSDSDIIVHMVATYFREYLYKIHFVFCDTGLEYKATKNHLDYLEEHYNIQIERLNYKKGVMPIPVAVKKYGVPFISKLASEYMGRLQLHNFTWEDGTVEKLLNKFGSCKSALRWWCNDNGEKSRFNINYKRGLKEYLLNKKEIPKISAKCCDKSKKEPVAKYRRKIKADLEITGERKSEGGIRAKGNSCFTHPHGMDKYMPLFFWDDDTKAFYKEKEKIKYSDCYEVYGLKRTGCVGCPFGLKCEEELEIMKKYEPNLFNACQNVFGKSYKMTREFEKFRKIDKN